MPRSLTHGSRKPGTGNAESVLHFPARAKLCSPDNLSSHVYLLRGGQVRLSHGDEVIVEHLNPGDFFGEDSLLRPRHRYEVATSLTPVTVSAFRSSQLLDRVQQDRRFAMRLLRSLASRLGRRRQVIRDFVAEPAERRLAWLLFRLAPVRPVSGWVRLNLSLSNSQLAKTIGTTRARISHFMQHFRQLGWLERRPELWVRREGLQGFLELSVKETSAPR
jgi:CRP-like cAMP-binding protein